MKTKGKKCEACGESSVVSIVYGMPTEEAFESARRGEIALGGCIIDFDNPTLTCISCGWDNSFDFERFISAQNQKIGGVESALTELSAGKKTSHWIWYIFPQIGLGSSPQAKRYAIGSLSEALAYLQHPFLGYTYLECLLAVSKYVSDSERPIIASLDNLFQSKIDRTKFISSITLFGEVATISGGPQQEHIASIWADLKSRGLTPCAATLDFIVQSPPWA